MIYSKVAARQDERQSQRYPTDFPGTLIVDRKPTTVRIGDISRLGAMIYAVGLPAVGTEVVLAGKAFEVVATVVWNTGEACGLRFHRSVDPLEAVRQNVPGMERFRTMGDGWRRGA
jgi:hypothetical protein